MYPVGFGVCPIGFGGVEKFQWGCCKISIGALDIFNGGFKNIQWKY